MSSSSLRFRRLLPVAVVAAATALALTGCQPGALAPSESSDAPEPSSSASEQPQPQPTPSASETTPGSEPESPTPTPAPTGTALPTTPPVAGDLDCSEVYTADQLYEFNPNFAPSSDEGSLPGAIDDVADAGGTVCAYQHVTGMDRLLIGVLTDAAGFAAPAFESVGDMGVATSPQGGAIVAVASQYFDQAQDAQPVIDQVADNLD
ncbi:hypothetical protein [Agrococcus jenensis]|uniref:Uncharacterized protein n=1 Tax=Agrococcus jenensis TaxID=46353 RepID=A0A3N2ATS2_9MICO|nr:hypothetical protein [Agrococcus jenensis]ROR66431.1 hypothetical protein EDD26_1814 [Agrococcus jenensis]